MEIVKSVCGKISCVRFVVVCLLYKANPNPRKKYLLWEKKWSKYHFLKLFFLGLGWPWFGEFVGFTVICIYFPTQPNLVHCKHPSDSPKLLCWLRRNRGCAGIVVTFPSTSLLPALLLSFPPVPNPPLNNSLYVIYHHAMHDSTLAPN